MAFVEKNQAETPRTFPIGEEEAIGVSGGMSGMVKPRGGFFSRPDSPMMADMHRPFRKVNTGAPFHGPDFGAGHKSSLGLLSSRIDRLDRPFPDVFDPDFLGRKFIEFITAGPILVLLAFFVFLYVVPLGVRPVVIPDETRYAEIPREMIVSGNWVSPRLNGLRYFEKPVLGLWAVGLSMRVFGETAFAMRLPSALSMGFCALLLFLLVRKYGPGRNSGLLAAGIYLTCLEVYALGVFNVLDGVLTLFLTGAMAAFFKAYRSDGFKERNLYLVIFGACCSLAALTKGFLAYAVPVSIIVPFMLWEGRWRKVFRMAVPALLAALVTALPWSVIVYLQEPDFWRYFFWVEHIQRFWSDNPQHPEPFWFFIPIVLAGAMPWTCLLPASLSGLRFNNPLGRYALCWFIFPFIFFSLSQGKLATYILPCFPPLALLAALGLSEYIRKDRRKALAIGAGICSGVVILVALGLLATQSIDLLGASIYGPDEKVKLLLGVGILFVWAAIAWRASRIKDAGRAIALFCLAPVIFFFGFHYLIPHYSREDKSPGDFLMKHQAALEPDAILVADRDLVTAVCWYYKRDDVYLIEKAGELTYGAGYEESRHRLLSFNDFKSLVETNRGKKDIVVITTTGYANQLVKRYDRAAHRDSQLGFSLIRY